MNKRQKSDNLVSFYLRLPAELKDRIDQESKERGTSQAQVVVDLCQRALDMPKMDPELKKWLGRVAQ
jgi:predicted DNA-binding protein